MQTFKQKVVSGAWWALVEHAGQQALGLIIGVILARLLSPADFGLIGMLAIFIALSQSFADMGIIQAIIRKPDLQEADKRTAFTINLLVSLVAYALLFGVAPGVASFFDAPDLARILPILALTIPIHAFAYVQAAVLQREMRLKQLALVQLAALVIAGVVALVMASRGAGYWSLVVQGLVYTATRTLLLFVTGWRSIGLQMDPPSARYYLNFGIPILGAGLLSRLGENLYSLIVGRLYGAAPLGLMVKAKHYAEMPTLAIYGVIYKALYPALSTLQDEQARISTLFLRAFTVLTGMLCSLLFLLAATAPSLIPLILGAQWEPMVPLFQVLCLGSVFIPLGHLNLNMLKVLGLAGQVFKGEVWRQLFLILAVLASAPFGLLAVSVCLSVAFAWSYVFLVWLVRAHTGVSMKQQLFAFAATCMAALLPAVAAWGVAKIWNTTSALSMLSIQGVAWGIVFFAIFWLFEPSWLRELNGILGWKSRSKAA